MKNTFKTLPSDIVWTDKEECPKCQSADVVKHVLTGVILGAGTCIDGHTAHCRACKSQFAIKEPSPLDTLLNA